MASNRNPHQILILVNVTFPTGPPVYTYRAFWDGSDAQTVAVGPGDQIAWFVKVQAGSGWIAPAYTLGFDNNSILGTSSISVPSGGSSGFFTVQALTGQTDYTLAVPGISPVSDPQIQVDPNGVFGIKMTGNQQYNVRWTAVYNTMEYQVGAGPWNPFPGGGLGITAGDKVQFFGVVTPPANFQIEFPAGSNGGNAWESPFSLLQSSFPALVPGVPNENTDNLPVKDKTDTGKSFTFDATLTDGSIKSGSYTFNLS
jgi:hypothetical protein